ncbi:hypothetical protein [Streptomyces sp. MA15]|nr:hypothetical protein [Streptomyces sp. MA15]MDN3272454.1 hypothetical protein [Streptomyces sp. MA15]
MREGSPVGVHDAKPSPWATTSDNLTFLPLTVLVLADTRDPRARSARAEP